MGKILNLVDRLTNVMSGMGTTADRRVYAGYNFTATTPQQVEAAYRSGWLMRKIIDLPASDMTRTWRDWKTESNNIELIEAEEKRLQLKPKVKRAIALARLWGGGAIVMGIKGQGDDPAIALDPSKVGKGGLTWLRVYARSQLAAGQLIEHPDDPYCGQPKSYTLNLSNGQSLVMHPSRVIPFVGQPAPEGSTMISDPFWGDPLYQSISTALQNADLAQDGFAGLIDEAKIDIVKMPDLMEKYSTAEYESRLLARLQAASMGKSNWRTLLLDGNEDWQQRQITWAGMPDIITSYLQIVSGAADIPITRLLGTSPKGLQSTGDGELQDYHDSIAARQDELVRPALERIDQFLIPSALGSDPGGIWFEFAPLAQLSEKDAMAIEVQRATTLKTYGDAGLIPPEVLSEIAENAMSESGQWPGSDEAFDAFELAAGTEPNEGAPELDPNAVHSLMTPAEIAAQDRIAPRQIIDAALLDATPKTLYVRRQLINTAEFISWAKAQGFKTTLAPGDLHVTIAFSRQLVDWMKIDADWSSDATGRFTVPAGGPRVVEPLGDKGAVVLMFNNDSLEYRHQRIHCEETGAHWEYPDFQPHVTITWDASGVDLANVVPYNGPLAFGPEIFEEIIDNWQSQIEEN